MDLLPPDPPLGDEEFVLRPWRMDDVPALVAACNDPEIGRWTRIPFPYTEDDARVFLPSTIDAWQDGTEASFAIVERESDALLGSIGVTILGEGRAGVGYWIARDARSRGLATRALSTVARWAIDELGIERLELVTDPENVVSQTVAERAGFVREGILRGYLPVEGGRRDCVMFSRLSSD
jgi:RimJ/RimL family protein N-acetyltransferase